MDDKTPTATSPDFTEDEVPTEEILAAEEELDAVDEDDEEINGEPVDNQPKATETNWSLYAKDPPKAKIYTRTDFGNLWEASWEAIQNVRDIVVDEYEKDIKFYHKGLLDTRDRVAVMKRETQPRKPRRVRILVEAEDGTIEKELASGLTALAMKDVPNVLAHFASQFPKEDEDANVIKTLQRWARMCEAEGRKAHENFKEFLKLCQNREEILKRDPPPRREPIRPAPPVTTGADMLRDHLASVRGNKGDHDGASFRKQRISMPQGQSRSSKPSGAAWQEDLPPGFGED